MEKRKEKERKEGDGRSVCPGDPGLTPNRKSSPLLFVKPLYTKHRSVKTPFTGPLYGPI